jgi:bile acid-coenzyme A ligase
MISLADTPSIHPGDCIALVHGEERWSFARLDERSAAWAQFLVERGVRHGDLVGFALPNGPDFIALTFGIYRAGATPAPLSAKLPLAEREAIIETMKPALFVTNETPDEDTRVLPPYPVSPSWKACTSGGSTGRPKVIVDGRIAGFTERTEFIGIPADKAILVPGPLYHNAPFSAAIFGLWRGCTVVTMDRFDAQGALKLIDREKVSWAIMVPTMMHRIWQLPNDAQTSYDLSSWEMVVHTAAPMAAWLKQEWIKKFGPDHIWEVYGATEGLVRCWIGGREWLERPGSVGRPIGGAELRILDEDGNQLPAGTEGEIYAMPPGGPRSSYQYIGANRRATADGWESVGDIGHLDQDGYLFLSDRRTDLIISGGVNIWPAEVEAAILRHPSVRSCAVQGVSDPDLGQQVEAIIETDDKSLDLASLSAFLSDYLVRSKHPRSLKCQPEPIRDDAGKFRKSPQILARNSQ